jgi:hypothetical protein
MGIDPADLYRRPISYSPRLFDQGIATVRIDKRGIYGSASALFDTDNTTIEDYAVDIRLWVTTIQRVDSRIARIRENAMI